MKITYIHHSGFLVETERCYYLFDYEKGGLPQMDAAKLVFVLSSHGHADHYNPEIFSLLKAAGIRHIRAVLSDDIKPPVGVEVLQVSPEQDHCLGEGQTLTTFRSTDLGVAFLIGDGQELIYHAGDLNDWVWDDESDAYNAQMTADYRGQIERLACRLQHRELTTAFVVLDPRQEQDYDRGLCWFLEHIPVKQVYPMHYWDQPAVIDAFLKAHPEYRSQIQRTE